MIHAVSSFTRKEMEREIERLSPFQHEIELPHGLRTRPEGQRRPGGGPPRVWEMKTLAFPPLLEHFGGSLEGLSVLEVACNAGGFAAEAARLGASRVLATDVVDLYVEQTRFVKEALGLENVEARKLSVYDVEPETIGGEFDVTFCFGLLYHLESPVLAMRKLGAVTRRAMVVDTTTLPTERDDRRAIWRMTFAPEAPEEGNERATTNLWRDRDYLQFEPSMPALRRLLRFVGFDEIRRAKPTMPGLSDTYYDGHRATVIAYKH